MKFLKLANSAEHFVAAGDPAYAKKASEQGAMLLENIKAEKPSITDAKHLKLIDAMEAGVAVYLDELAETAKLVEEHDHLVKDVLEVNGAKVVVDLDKIQEEAKAENNVAAQFAAGKAREHALLAMVHTTRMIAGEEAAAAESEREFELTEKAFAALAPTLHTASERSLYDEALKLFDE